MASLIFPEITAVMASLGHSIETLSKESVSNGIKISITLAQSKYGDKVGSYTFSNWVSHIKVDGVKRELLSKTTNATTRSFSFIIPVTKDDINKSIDFCYGSSSNTGYMLFTAKENDNDSINIKLYCSSSTIPSGWFNSSPTIDGEESRNINLGEKNQAFSVNYTVSDDDLDDILVVKEYLDGVLYNTRNNTVRDTEYEFCITKEMLYSLEKDVTHTVSISVSDGKSETTNNYRFVRTNLLPVIDIIMPVDESIEYSSESPKIKFKCSDPENEELKASILVDDILVFGPDVVASNTETEISVSLEKWINIINGRHKFTLRVEDTQGGIAEHDYNFVKNETVIDFQFKEPVETDVAIQKYYSIISKLNIDNSSIRIYLTNNGFDDNPTWEEANGTPHTFSNSTKTSDKWGFNIRVVITRGSETGDMRVYGIGGSLQ